MHRSRYYRNPALYHPRSEVDPPRYVYGPNSNQITRNTFKRTSVTSFSPAHKRDVGPYSTKPPAYGNPRFADRSKYVWTANKQQQASQTTTNPSVQTQVISAEPSSVAQVPSTTQLPHSRLVSPIKKTPVRTTVLRNSGNVSRRELNYLTVTSLDEPNAVAIDIASKLQEEKFYIIRKVVDVLGVKKAIKLFYETREKELNGGILIQNGKRRRTPGGVYLTLLRESSFIPKQEADKVFLEIKRHESKLKIAHYQMF